MTGLYILVISVAVCLIIGVLVLSKSSWDKTVATYGGLTLTMIAMSIMNYLAIEADTNQLLYVRLVMATSTIAIYLVYLLIVYLGGATSKPLYKSALFYATFLVAMIDLSEYLFSGIVPGSPPQPIPGPAISVYFIHFFVTFIVALISLYMMRKDTGSAKRKQQYRLLIIGIIPILVFAPITSFILPNIFGINNFLILTPLYGLIFAASVGYAVIRHGLFDVKAATVRSVAYLLSILTMAGVYVSLAYAISASIFAGDASSEMVSISPINVVLALVLALIFQPVRQFFDKVTAKLFLRGSYDLQEIAGSISSACVELTDLNALIGRVGELLNQALAPEYLLIVFNDNVHQEISIGKVPKQLQKPHAALRDELAKMNMKLGESRQMLGYVAGVYHLKTSSQHLGHIVVGYKRNSRPYSHNDVTLMNLSVNEISIAVQNIFRLEEIRSFATTLEHEVDDATSELRRSNKKLLELDATKDEFVGMASHQLRTPLTSVKGYISMVLEGDAGKITTQQRQLLQEAFTSSERMVHLIADFLNVSRLQTGKFVVDRKEVDLAAIIGQEVTNIKQIAASHDIHLEYKPSTRIPHLYLDEGKMRQVIMNFIDNAIYYSPDNTQIKITLTVEDGEVVLRVIDKGMGVPEEAQAKLFTKFFRAENARRQRPDGTGVGLFLAKKVIDGHGGFLVFESTPGKGSTFGFRLPIKEAE